MIFADGKGGKMEQVEKWCRVHKKACLVTGIMGLLLAPFLLYRKDRLWRSLELKNARTEAGTTTRRFLD